MTIKIHPEVDKIKSNIIENRRDFHKHPELSFKEFRTSKIVANKLRSYGLEVKTGIGKTGVTADLVGNESGSSIALRADMDALPIQETSNLEFKSINDGVMHACGHDGHTAMLLGAARVLSNYKKKIKGRVRFIFQPAEEGKGGARYMIKDNVLDGINQIYGAHLWNYQQCGTISTKVGPIMAAADMFKIDIRGRGGHGAMPQGTNDTILAASQLINSLQTIVSRSTNPLESAVLTVGKINGGHNFNVIADHVKLEGTTRAYTEKNREMIKQKMENIILGIEKITGADIKLDYEDGYPPVINDDICSKNLLHSASKVVSQAGEPYLTMGGEDFSYFSNEIPGCFFFIGSAPKGTKPLEVPHHCSHFNIDEDALAIGSSAFVQLIEDLLIVN